MAIDVTPLASSAASTIVGLMVTDAWSEAKRLLVGLWQRHQPHMVGRVAGELDQARHRLVIADPNWRSGLQAGVQAEWETRLRQLVADQAAARDLAGVVKQLTSLSVQVSAPTAQHRVRTRDHSPVYQPTVTGTGYGSGAVSVAGRDIHNNHDYSNNHDPTRWIFEGRGPGRLLAALGSICTLAAFVALMSSAGANIINGKDMSNLSVKSFLGHVLPSGTAVGVVYFIGIFFGIGVAVIGTSMARAGAHGKRTGGHVVLSLAIVALGVVILQALLGGAPLSTLTPKFSISTHH